MSTWSTTTRFAIPNSPLYPLEYLDWAYEKKEAFFKLLKDEDLPKALQELDWKALMWVWQSSDAGWSVAFQATCGGVTITILVVRSETGTEGWASQVGGRTSPVETRKGALTKAVATLRRHLQSKANEARKGLESLS